MPYPVPALPLTGSEVRRQAFKGEVNDSSLIYINPCTTSGNGQVAVMECGITFGNL